MVGGQSAGPDKSRPAKPAKIKIHAQGEIFCPAAALVFGDMVISPSRCYVVYVLRDSRGTFLAFAPRDAKIPPGQLVLGSPAKVVRTLDSEAERAIAKSAANYVANGQRYARGLKKIG